MEANGMAGGEPLQTPPMRGALGEITEGLLQPGKVFAGIMKGSIYAPNRNKGVTATPANALMEPMAEPKRGPGSIGQDQFFGQPAPQLQAGIAAPAPASRGPASIVQQGVAQDPTNAMPMYFNQQDSPRAGVLKTDFTDSLKVEADAQAPAAEVSAADRTAGSAFLGMGLQMMGDGATAPAFEEQLGGIGMTVAGIAKLAGVGGKWAAPVAVLGALTNMAGMRKSAKMEGDHKARIFRSYAKALASAGSLYRGR
jgi:hypothetical protein